MPATLGFKPTTKSLIGVALLACGTLVMATQLWTVASRYDGLLNATASDCLGTLATLGVASLRALQSVVFDHSILLSLASTFLLSFTAFAIAVAGLALLRNGAPRKAR